MSTIDMSELLQPEEKLVRKMYKVLEDDFEVCLRYVEPSRKNLETYSIEFHRFLQDACQELDTLFKLRLRQYDEWPRKSDGTDFPRKGVEFKHYYPLKRELLLRNRKIQLKDGDIECDPYSDWKKSKPPSWWSDHNDLKHHRIEHFEKATLENAINSLAALYLLLTASRTVMTAPVPTKIFKMGTIW